jgi:predicted dehydrogenase
MTSAIPERGPLTARSRVTIAVVGCGAAVERLHAPALSALAAKGEVEVVALCDPNAARIAAIAARFPRAAAVTAIEGVNAVRPELALVASPAGLHASHSIALLEAGTHVFCEKPIAANVTEADRMVAAAARARRVLAVGLIRRFFPSARLVRDLIVSGRFGALESASILETGGFHWPFRSTSAFVPQLTPGGILLDLGVHVLDLLAWWFPRVRLSAYEDDAMGGSEATAVATVEVGRAPIVVKLSRDWPMPGRYDLRFEHGRIVWDGVDPVAVQLEYALPSGGAVRLDAAGAPVRSWDECFRAQLENVVAAVRGESTLVVSGSDAMPSLSLIEQCYRLRTLLPSPWFTGEELNAARDMAGERVTS